MKKHLLLLALAISTAFPSFAETFVISGASSGWPNKMSAYASTYTSSAQFGGTNWTGEGFANNNGEWQFLRFGAKSSTEKDAFLSSVNAVEYAVTEVCVNVTTFIRGTINSATLLIADNKDFTNANSVNFSGDFTKAGEWKATITSPAANKYYKINFNYTNTTSKNGVFDTDKITFTYTTDPIQETVSDPTISNVKGQVTLDCSTTGATIMYHVGEAAVTDASACTDEYKNTPFSVTKGQWVSAYAKKDGATASKVVSKQITWESLPVGDVVSTPAADGDVITVERGSIITFSATNADALAFEADKASKATVSNPYEYTVTDATSVMVTPIQDGAEVEDKKAMFSIKIKAAELCGEVVFTPATGAEIATGSTITATAENAVKYAYAFGDATPTVVNNSTLTVTAPSEAGDYTLTVTPYNVDGVAGTTATAEYTVSAPAIASFDIFFKCSQSTGAQISGTNAASLEYMVHTDSYAKVTSVSAPSNLCGGPENNGKRGIRFGTYASGSYKKGSLTINLAHAYKIISIDVILTTYKSSNSKAPKNPTWNLDINGHTMATALTSDVTTPTTYTIPFESTLSRAADGLEDALTIKSTDAPVDVYSLKINFDPVVSGIEKVTFTNEDADAPVEYFNLQGVRVQNPGQGLYIRRQGNRVEKVALR